MRRLTCGEITTRKIRWAVARGLGLWPEDVLRLYDSIAGHHRQPIETEAPLFVCRQLFTLENTHPC